MLSLSIVAVCTVAFVTVFLFGMLRFDRVDDFGGTVCRDADAEVALDRVAVARNDAPGGLVRAGREWDIECLPYGRSRNLWLGRRDVLARLIGHKDFSADSHDVVAECEGEGAQLTCGAEFETLVAQFVVRECRVAAARVRPIAAKAAAPKAASRCSFM